MIRDLGPSQAPTRTLAAVRRRVRIGEVATAWKPALDEAWAFLREHPELRAPGGHNVFLYHHPARRDAPMEVDFGVEVLRAFTDEGPVRCVVVPGGRVLGATHVGPYDALRPAHDAIHAWARDHGLEIGAASWEIYGDPSPDASRNETRVEYSLAPQVVLIVAASENDVIGRDGKMPWHLSEDLKRFKRLTLGHRIAMGRKTWESIGRALPGRENVVVTRQPRYHADGARVVGSLKEALEGATGDVFVIGGGEIYAQALPLAHRIELTRVHRTVDGDARFPTLGPEWRETAREAHDGFTFLTLDRARPPSGAPPS